MTSEPPARTQLVRLALTALGTGGLCLWLRSWREWPTLVYDASLGIALCTCFVEGLSRWRTRFTRRDLASLLVVGLAMLVAAGRLVIGYAVPISGHLTIASTLLGLSLLDRGLRARDHLVFLVPWVAIAAVRWTVFDWTHHWQSLGAVGAGVALALFGWLGSGRYRPAIADRPILHVRRRAIIAAAVGMAAYGLVSVGVGAYLLEGALRPGRASTPATARESLAALGAVTDVEITVAGVRQRAWYLVPLRDRGDAALVLHGIGDQRAGMLGQARLLARRGYRILLPDLRAHGASEGEISTYGVLERQDAAAWQRWLTERGARCVVGLGSSLGAAVLLQSLAEGARFCGIVAECTYASFHEVALDRLGGGHWLRRQLLRPMLAGSIVYARVRHGVDLGRASPVQAIAGATTPILLLHGDADDETPPAHSMRVQAARPAATELWSVPGAGHAAAIGRAPIAYERRVVGWFDTLPRP